MALVTPTPLDPTIAADIANVTTGSGVGFATSLQSRLDDLESRTKLLEARLEKQQAQLQFGALSGGTIAAGAGLSVTVTLLTALVGCYVETDATQTVGGLTASTTNYLWLRQDGTVTSNTSGSKPSSGDGKGDALLWGTATTDTTSVTAVSNERRIFQTETRLSKSVAGSSNVTLTVAEARNRHIECTGALTGNIELRVPLSDGAEWVIFNNTSGAFTLTVKGATGTGIVVAQGKTAILRGNGTNVLRVTADNP